MAFKQNVHIFPISWVQAIFLLQDTGSYPSAAMGEQVLIKFEQVSKLNFLETKLSQNQR